MSSLKGRFAIPGISGRVLMIILCAMLLVHIIVFLYFSQKNKSVELRVNHEIITQQVMHVIETILQAPIGKRKQVVEAIDIPSMKVSLDEKPQFKPQLTSSTLWPILVALRKQRQHLQLSLQLDKDDWLNLYATVVPTSWTLQIVLLALELIVATSLLFFVWSINRFSMPLREFMQVAERVGVDLNSPPVKVSGPSVVRDTAHAMNQMQKRIQDLIRDRTQMLAAMSHDLRTPITRLRLRAQFIEDIEQREKNIADLNEMEVMIKETLDFAREDHGMKAKVKLDFASLLEAICHDYSDMGMQVEFMGCDERMLILGRSMALKRAFTNIINNALKYAGHARVILSRDKETIKILIEDDGPGIPEDELEKVLAPFYRGEKSRSRYTGGTGLGLAVTRDTILAHQGFIKLENREEGGLRVIVALRIKD